MNLRNQKGINMITLSVAVIILLVITSVLVYNSKDGVKIKGLSNLYNDIEELNTKVGAYYVKNGDIPKGAKYENEDFLDKLELLDEKQKNPNNGDAFYVINLKALEGVSLNYGREYDSIKEKKSDDVENTIKDLYVINEASHTIYYAQGIEVKNKTYYTEPDDNWTQIELNIIPIYTAEQLSKIGSGETIKIKQTGNEYKFNMDCNYVLQSDIDLKAFLHRDDEISDNDTSWNSIGTESNPFSGKFYGNGYTINNLYINSEESDQGVFGYNTGKIDNLSVTGTIFSGSKSGGIAGNNSGEINNCINLAKIKCIKNSLVGSEEISQIGGIVGLNQNNGKVSYCYNKGEISGNGYNIGGIAGQINTNGEIECCKNEGKIIGTNYVGGIVGGALSGITKKCINIGKIEGTACIGGISGLISGEGEILLSYNAGEINALHDAGGISGICGSEATGAKGSIYNCYNIGKITGGTNTGGIIGNIVISQKIENCYYLKDSSLAGTYPQEKAIEKNSTDMKKNEFIELLNTDQGTDSPWVVDTIGENDGYPILDWQID